MLRFRGRSPRKHVFDKSLIAFVARDFDGSRSGGSQAVANEN
jgi:hypothetical protein